MNPINYIRKEDLNIIFNIMDQIENNVTIKIDTDPNDGVRYIESVMYSIPSASSDIEYFILSDMIKGVVGENGIKIMKEFLTDHKGEHEIDLVKLFES